MRGEWRVGRPQFGDVNDPFEPPIYEEVLADLKKLRRAGLTKIRTLQLAALDRAALAAGEKTIKDIDDYSSIRRLLTRAVGQLGGGRFEDAAETLFGLGGGQIGTDPRELRTTAIQQWGVARSTFREHEKRGAGPTGRRSPRPSTRVFSCALAG